MSGFSNKRKFEVSHAESRSESRLSSNLFHPLRPPDVSHTPYFRVHCTLTLPRSSSTVRKKWIANFGLLGFGKFIFYLHSQKVITVDLSQKKPPKTTKNTTLLSENKLWVYLLLLNNIKGSGRPYRSTDWRKRQLDSEY